VLVDPEILRAFAGQVDTASSTITAADIGAKVSSAGDGFPGFAGGVYAWRPLFSIVAAIALLASSWRR
jgi:hypothetical protein